MSDPSWLASSKTKFMASKRTSNGNAEDLSRLFEPFFTTKAKGPVWGCRYAAKSLICMGVRLISKVNRARARR